MKLRPWILGAVLVGALGVNGYLVIHERIAVGESEARHRTRKEDPLIDLPYTSASRSSDFGRFGLVGPLLTQAVERVQEQDEANRALLKDRIENVGDPDLFLKTFCRTDRGGLPPHYSGLAWLVQDEGGRRSAISVPRITSLEPGEWASRSPIAEVYATVELNDDRKPDATVMGLAAILLGREDEAIHRRSPWGQGLGGRWSWERLQKEDVGIADQVMQYLVLLHLTMEIVTAEGGFCSD
ncbi:MAG: hypothetical protein JXB39_12435 [Deltaproteobacteria bacterium]|nr:hypothetical protein [Deltaproteobacteria bacterium]